MQMNDFNILFPMQKVDQKKRIVTGIATANNVDLANDVIEFEASLDAFANWVGNIREMHDPKKAVGTMIDYRPTSIMYNGKMYDAIEVDIYISKGAEDTWQKILDGTLKGFSIGGKALEKKNMYDPETGEMVTHVTKYLMGELSVVDNPCNPTGMFMLIKKAADGTLVDISEVENQSVFYCETHKYATINNNKFCPECGQEMKEIGVVETFNADVINKVISDFENSKKEGESGIMDLHENTNNATISNMNDFTDEQKTTLLKRLGSFLFDGVSATPAVAPNVTVNIHKGLLVDEVKEVEDKVEKSVDEINIEEKDDAVEKSVDLGSEVEDSNKEDEMDIEELLKGVSSLLDEKLGEVKAEISAEVDAKIDEINKSVSDFKDETDATLAKNAEELEKVSNTGAIQKSVDIEEVEDDKIEKSVSTVESFWGGIFVPGEFAEALGYDS